jgi:organic hydroperoxide reductase OsmC/OhrA
VVRLSVHEAQGRITKLEAELVLGGALSAEQLVEVTTAAETCRVSRALAVPVELRVTGV